MQKIMDLLPIIVAVAASGICGYLIADFKAKVKARDRELMVGNCPHCLWPIQAEKIIYNDFQDPYLEDDN